MSNPATYNFYERSNASFLPSPTSIAMHSGLPSPYGSYGNDSRRPGAGTRKPCALFVGDLSFFCTEMDLAQLFSPFGPIDNLEIKRGRHGDSLMHGFVEFVQDSDASRAIQALDNRKFMGRHMRVYFITHEKVAPRPQSESWVQVHVNFLTPAVSKKVTEEFLESVFEAFGSIGDIQVKRHLCSQQPAQVTGYAFVYFTEVHAALRAIYALKNFSVESVLFECCLSYKAEQMLKEMQGMEGVIRRQQTPNPSAFFKRNDHGPNVAAPIPPAHGYHQHLPPTIPSPPTSARGLSSPRGMPMHNRSVSPSLTSSMASSLSSVGSQFHNSMPSWMPASSSNAYSVPPPLQMNDYYAAAPDYAHGHGHGHHARHMPALFEMESSFADAHVPSHQSLPASSSSSLFAMLQLEQEKRNQAAMMPPRLMLSEEFMKPSKSQDSMTSSSASSVNGSSVRYVSSPFAF